MKNFQRIHLICTLLLLATLLSLGGLLVFGVAHLSFGSSAPSESSSQPAWAVYNKLASKEGIHALAFSEEDRYAGSSVTRGGTTETRRELVAERVTSRPYCLREAPAEEGGRKLRQEVRKLIEEAGGTVVNEVVLVDGFLAGTLGPVKGWKSRHEGIYYTQGRSHGVVLIVLQNRGKPDPALKKYKPDRTVYQVTVNIREVIKKKR